ncbi:MAG: glutamate synthase large chain, partial [Mycobacterium sp.]|nr:glutamate synthase large chain [Mycobacterium sp.]
MHKSSVMVKDEVGMAPQMQGLYNPAYEHDSCGVAMVADMHGRRSR